METFYDGDLKDIWDSDLDPTESLKISTDTDLHDWFLERDIKDPAVILNDKLISDALLNGTLPIKTEHSYSLNSDGDSLPDSPRSLQTKMDDMEDECYPAISLKTATSNLRHHHHHHHHGHALHHADTAATIDPKCLTISTSPPTTTASAIAMHCSPVAVTSLAINNNSLLTTTPASTSGFSTSYAAGAASTTTATSLTFHQSHHHNHHHNNNNNNNNHSHNSIYASLNKITASAPMTFNLRNLDNSNNNNNNSNHNIGGGATTITFVKNTTTIQAQSQQQQQQQQQQYLPQQHISSMDSESICDSPISTRDGSTSPDICSDIEIDESFIKDEPMSPDSSCPPSPNTTNAKAKGGGGSTLSLSMANMAQYTNSDLVFEHKNGCLQLTPASHSLLKSQQLLLSSTSSNSQNIIIPKFNIKNETTTLPNGTYINGTTPAKHNNNGAGTYGLPLTPPSSSPSDESEGNLTPEHLLSPLSPNTSVSISVATAAASGGPAIVTTTARRSTSSSSSSSSSNNSNCLGAGSGRNINGGGGGGGANAGGGGSTRQPIHTPLISSQPKGSTGTLILTEEEKRTLLAEGYPIPQKLPLTKAEEKSLKKIRRKIKNKISAQESRRKKKEYMDQLERRVEILVNENKDYRKRVETLEDSNSNLLSQLHKLQALVSKQNMKK